MKCPKCYSDNPDTLKFCGECGTQITPIEEAQPFVTKTIETPREELTTGSTFAGRYHIIEELGRGGMGRVYKAVDTKIKEKIALKLIMPEISSDRKTLERFGNELKLARKIVHKNVGRMFDINEEKGTHFITMEYVSGQDLKGLIRQSGQLAIGTTISIAKQICEGLSEAHKVGVVHRDLKPNNIMIDREGEVRIMDFGIARSMKAKGITGAGVMIGTPEYMSPEQVEGKEVDQRSDIYSLGIILYEMVTGRVPFEGDTPLSIAYKHKHEAPPDPRKINAQIPDDLNHLILKCLEKEKERRYQSASEFISELEKIEKGIPTTEKSVPKRKPLTSREITVQLSLRKAVIPIFVFIAIVFLALIVWKLLPLKKAQPVLSVMPSLAIMHFENNTGDETLEHWRKALSELLVADLVQSQHLNVLSGDRLYKILSQLDQLDTKSYSSDVLAEVASRGGVKSIVRGGFTRAGENYRINIMILEAGSGEVIGSERVEGRGEDSFFTMVDELTRRIKARFLIADKDISSDIDREVGAITTNSPEAFKHYSEGLRFYSRGDYRQSIDSMEEALAKDPEFAMAYRSMALSFDELKLRDLARQHLQRALELSDRLSERERLLIQGNLAHRSSRAVDRAFTAYNQLLKLYPEDQEGNLSLAMLHRTHEQWDKAIELAEINRKNKDDSVQTYLILSYAYGAKGQYTKVQETLESYLAEFSDNALIHQELALNYLCQGKDDLALVEIEKAFALDPGFWQHFRTRAHIYLSKGNFSRAESDYMKILDLDEEGGHLWSRSWLGSLYLMEGKFEKSINQLKQGLELSKRLGEKGAESGFYSRLAYTYLKSDQPDKALEESIKGEKSSLEERGCLLCHQNWSLLYKGLAQMRKESLEEAQRTAVELRDLTQTGLNENYMRLYYHLAGMEELQDENYSAAIDHFKKAVSRLSFQASSDNLSDQAFFIDALAFAYFQAGDFDKAQEEYERITALTLGMIHWGDIYAKSFYMLGKIFEQKEWAGKAIENYEKFLSLWKDADPGLPEVADARERVVGLKDR